jgi:hypothetical protein
MKKNLKFLLWVGLFTLLGIRCKKESIELIEDREKGNSSISFLGTDGWIVAGERKKRNSPNSKYDKKYSNNFDKNNNPVFYKQLPSSAKQDYKPGENKAMPVKNQNLLQTLKNAQSKGVWEKVYDGNLHYFKNSETNELFDIKNVENRPTSDSNINYQTD